MSAPVRTRVLVLGGLCLALVVGCGAEPVGAPAPSPLPTPSVPTLAPTPSPTLSPTASPTASPSVSPSASPSASSRHRSTALRQGDRGTAVLALHP